MNQLIVELLENINPFTSYENDAISCRAKKITHYIEEYQSGRLEEDELKDLIEDLDNIEASAGCADTKNTARKLNKIIKIVFKAI